MSARPARPLVLILLGLSCFVPPADASWNADGNAVCTAAGAQTGPTSVTDGSGGMFVVWTDARPGAVGFYAQRMLGDGTIAPGWPANGVLCSGTTALGPRTAMVDGAGGVLIFWLADGSWIIYAQRIDANGTIHAGWPAGGKAVVPWNFTMSHGCGAVPDGAGGAYVTRARLESGVQTLRITRITPDGTIASGWTQAGTAIAYDTQVDLYSIKPDPTGGVVCGVMSFQNPPVGDSWRFGRVLRVSPSATITLYSDCTAHQSGNVYPGGITNIVAAPDGAGGVYGVWHDFNSATGTHGEYGQHFLTSAQGQWTTPYPVPVCNVIQDGSAGVWLPGSPMGTQRLEVHRRLADGTLPTGWTTAGVVISMSTTAYSFAPTPTELVVGWAEGSGATGKDIRALSVAQDGSIPGGWDPGGTLFCAANGDQTYPWLQADGAGGMLACWEDRRPGATESDIYANRISLPSQVGIGPEPPVSFGILGAWPNPARDRIEITFALAADAPATLQLIDLAGRSVHRSHLSPGAGRRTIPLALGGLANGVYFLRVIQGPRTASTRVAIAR